MKEKRTYKRFDAIAILAVIGCLAMLLFEGFFIFEVYDRDFFSQTPSSLPPTSNGVDPVVEKPVSSNETSKSTPVKPVEPMTAKQPAVPATNEPAVTIEPQPVG